MPCQCIEFNIFLSFYWSMMHWTKTELGDEGLKKLKWEETMKPKRLLQKKVINLIWYIQHNDQNIWDKLKTSKKGL